MVVRVEKGEIEAKHKRLNNLIVQKAVLKTSEFDEEINKLQSEFDYFNFGIK